MGNMSGQLTQGSARWSERFFSGVVPVVMCCTMKPCGGQQHCMSLGSAPML